MQVNRLSLLVLHYLRSFRCLNQWSLQTLCRLHIFLHWEIENDSVSGWNCEWVNVNCRPTMLPCSWVSHMQCCYYYILLGLGHIIIYCNTHNIRREEEQACMYAFTFYQSVCTSPPGCLPPVPGLLWSHSQRPAVPGHLVQVAEAAKVLDGWSPVCWWPSYVGLS